MTQTVELGELIDVVRGISYKSSDYCDSDMGLAFINLKCVERGGGFRADGVKYYKGRYKPSQLVSFGDILIANTDLTQNREVIGSPIIMPEIGRDACLSLDLSKLVIRDENVLDKDYLFYFLKSPIAREYMIAHSNGSTVVHLSVKTVPLMLIKLPAIEDQRRIGRALRDVDEKIKLNQRMNETLEQMGQALFRHYFIANPTVKTWRIGRIIDIAKVTDYVANGSFASLKENVTLYDREEYALYIRTTDYKNGFKGNLKYVDHKSYDFLKKSSLDGSEFIISNVGDVGTVFKAPVWLNKPMTLASNVVMVRDSIYNNYLYLYFRGRDGQCALSNITAGSAQPKFNKTEFRNLKIRVPDDVSLSKFNTSYDLLSEQLVNINAEVQTLASLRDTLLPRLISEKLRV